MGAIELAGGFQVKIPSANAALLAVALFCPAAGPANSGAVPGLYEVSQNLQQWYNTGDAAAIRSALSADLAKKYPVGAIQSALEPCYALFGRDITRLSLPTSGTKNYAFFAVYMPSSNADMILEIDNSGKIVFWSMSKDLMAADFRCSLRDF